MATPAVSTASMPDSVEALKRVKAAEMEWDTRVAQARQESDAALDALRANALSSAKEARTEAEKEHAHRVAEARAETDAEVEAILADGRAAAAKALEGAGRRPADKKSEILDAVLGDFGRD